MYKLPVSALNLDEVRQAEIWNRMREKAKAASEERVNLNYKCPRTEEEWWKVVETYWDELLIVADKYVNLKAMEGLDGKMSVRTLLFNAITAKHERDPALSQLFSRAWCQSPDSGVIHGDLAWGILCDLCSESYLLSGESEE